MQYTSASMRAATFSLGELARKLFVSEISVFSARYQSSNTTKSKIVANDIYIFNAQNEIVKDEPANIKRFVTPIDGSNFRVYREEHAKFTDITVEHYSNIIVTAKDGIKWLSITDGTEEMAAPIMGN
jgi:hypothetical protein